MNKVKVISYYTNTGIYPEFVKRLKDSCERFSLPYEIRRRDDQGQGCEQDRGQYHIP